MTDYKELVARLRTMQALEHDADAVIEAAEAIERLSAELEERPSYADVGALTEELAALKSASAEPVAWFHKANGRVYLTTSPEPDEDPREVGYAPVPNWQPLYLHPAPAAVLEGWQLVPKEPTLEMIDAVMGDFSLRDEYKAMLAAAPKPEGEKP